MKTETLFKRLAEKTATPLLEQVLTREASPLQLPATCMVWRGAMTSTGQGIRAVKRRDADNLPYTRIVQTYPYAKINWQGQTHLVHRLILELLHEPDIPFRAQATCDTPGCVNPLHWKLVTILEDEDDDELEPIMTDDWTLEDVEELVEIMLTEQAPASWEDVSQSPILEGAPHEMIVEVLEKLNRRHLLP